MKSGSPASSTSDEGERSRKPGTRANQSQPDALAAQAPLQPGRPTGRRPTPPAERDIGAAARGDDRGVRHRAAGVGDERVGLGKTRYGALADQVDDRLAEEEHGHG